MGLRGLSKLLKSVNLDRRRLEDIESIGSSGSMPTLHVDLSNVLNTALCWSASFHVPLETIAGPSPACALAVVLCLFEVFLDRGWTVLVYVEDCCSIFHQFKKNVLAMKSISSPPDDTDKVSLCYLEKETELQALQRLKELYYDDYLKEGTNIYGTASRLLSVCDELSSHSSGDLFHLISSRADNDSQIAAALAEVPKERRSQHFILSNDTDFLMLEFAKILPLHLFQIGDSELHSGERIQFVNRLVTQYHARVWRRFSKAIRDECPFVEHWLTSFPIAGAIEIEGRAPMEVFVSVWDRHLALHTLNVGHVPSIDPNHLCVFISFLMAVINNPNDIRSRSPRSQLCLSDVAKIAATYCEGAALANHHNAGDVIKELTTQVMMANSEVANKEAFAVCQKLLTHHYDRIMRPQDFLAMIASMNYHSPDANDDSVVAELGRICGRPQSRGLFSFYEATRPLYRVNSAKYSSRFLNWEDVLYCVAPVEIQGWTYQQWTVLKTRRGLDAARNAIMLLSGGALGTASENWLWKIASDLSRMSFNIFSPDPVQVSEDVKHFIDLLKKVANLNSRLPSPALLTVEHLRTRLFEDVGSWRSFHYSMPCPHLCRIQDSVLRRIITVDPSYSNFRLPPSPVVPGMYAPPHRSEAREISRDLHPRQIVQRHCDAVTLLALAWQLGDTCSLMRRDSCPCCTQECYAGFDNSREGKFRESIMECSIRFDETRRAVVVDKTKWKSLVTGTPVLKKVLTSLANAVCPGVGTPCCLPHAAILAGQAENAPSDRNACIAKAAIFLAAPVAYLALHPAPAAVNRDAFDAHQADVVLEGIESLLQSGRTAFSSRNIGNHVEFRVVLAISIALQVGSLPNNGNLNIDNFLAHLFDALCQLTSPPPPGPTPQSTFYVDPDESDGEEDYIGESDGEEDYIDERAENITQQREVYETRLYRRRERAQSQRNLRTRRPSPTVHIPRNTARAAC